MSPAPSRIWLPLGAGVGLGDGPEATADAEAPAEPDGPGDPDAPAEPGALGPPLAPAAPDAAPLAPGLGAPGVDEPLATADPEGCGAVLSRLLAPSSRISVAAKMTTPAPA